jgi:hypothetical protein
MRVVVVVLGRAVLALVALAGAAWVFFLEMVRLVLQIQAAVGAVQQQRVLRLVVQAVQAS